MEPISTPADSSAPTASPHLEPWSMTNVPSHLRLWLVTIAGLSVDLWSKHWAFSTLKHDEPRSMLGGIANLQLSLNPGALFGIGAGFAPIFVGASVLALLFVLYLFANTGASRWTMHIALGLVLGGALGNLYDRSTQEAFVAYTPAGRDIGLLVRQEQSMVELANFPDGGNRRTVRLIKDAPSGIQPVVRDFIKIETRIGGIPLWPWIFNIADALLVVGVILLLFNFWFDRRQPNTVGADSAPNTADLPHSVVD